MNCLDKNELEQFLTGKLHSQRLLAVDEHVCSCAQCKAQIAGARTGGRARAALGATLLDVYECPEYEELSALVDNALETDRAKTVRAHANACEFCARDIASIEEMRSHAALRGKVKVTPGMSGRAPRPASGYWKRALAAVSLAAAVAVVAISFGYFGRPVDQPADVAATPPPAHSDAIPKPEPSTATAPDAPVAVPGSNMEQPAPKPVPPAYVAVLKDGDYQVIKKNGKLLLAKTDGTPVKTLAPIDEKLRTGSIQPAKPVRMAMATIAVRGSDGGYVPPPSAAKLVSPVGRVVVTSTPTFDWSAVDLADAYRLRVFDEDGNLLIEETADGNSLSVARPLVRGELYMWRIGVRFSEYDSWAESASGTFYVLSADDYASIQNVKRQLPGSHLALGAAYERCGLYDEAASEYRALRRQNPNSALARELLYGTPKAGR